MSNCPLLELSSLVFQMYYSTIDVCLILRDVEVKILKMTF